LPATEGVGQIAAPIPQLPKIPGGNCPCQLRSRFSAISAIQKTNCGALFYRLKFIFPAIAFLQPFPQFAVQQRPSLGKSPWSRWPSALEKLCDQCMTNSVMGGFENVRPFASRSKLPSNI
jgi:hypothetical protein